MQENINKINNYRQQVQLIKNTLKIQFKMEKFSKIWQNKLIGPVDDNYGNHSIYCSAVIPENEDSSDNTIDNNLPNKSGLNNLYYGFYWNNLYYRGKLT